jgi:undecaprenyl-diphosphatase
LTIAQAIVLGLIQGLSEFLPISSTAHLTLAGRAMDLIDPAAPERWTEFIAIVQLGTLLAVLLYFARDIITITGAFVRENLRRVPLREQSFAARSGWMIILGTIPIVAIGLALKDLIEGALTKNLIVIGTSLVVLAILLEIAERVARFERPIEKMTMRDAVFIGTAQAVALIPGSSRSGTTLTAGLFAGLTREAAARFSFLLSIPAVAASGLLEAVKVAGHIDGSGVLTLAIATVVAGISGYAAIAFLLRYLRTHSTRLFVAYRLLLGGGILVAVALGWLGA